MKKTFSLLVVSLMLASAAMSQNVDTTHGKSMAHSGHQQHKNWNKSSNMHHRSDTSNMHHNGMQMKSSADKKRSSMSSKARTDSMK